MSEIRNHNLCWRNYAIGLLYLSTPLYLCLVLRHVIVAGGHD